MSSTSSAPPTPRPARIARCVPVFGLCLALVPVPSFAVQRRGFVTSIDGTGNISTWPNATGATVLDKADSVCRFLAGEADPPLPNPTTYRAWLSTSGTDAYCHVQGLTGRYDDGCGGANLPGAGPWFLPNGLTIATAPVDRLVEEGEIYRAFSFDENGDPLSTTPGDRDYWTGTSEAGEAAAGQTCGDWTVGTNTATGRGGDAYAGAVSWTSATTQVCDGDRRLLCLEPGPGDGAPLGWAPAAIVFLTSENGTGELGEWPEAALFEGVNAGYEICRTFAAAAFLPSPESFVPWLSTQFVPAADRLATDGPFRRIDGTRVAAGLDDLLDGGLSSGIYQYEDGRYLEGSQRGVWTGTTPVGEATADTCVNWFDGTSGVDGTTGRADYGAVTIWTDEVEPSCDEANRLYCISNTITLFWDGFELTHDTSRWSEVVAP